MKMTPEDEHLHSVIMAYTKPLQKQIDELRNVHACPKCEGTGRKYSTYISGSHHIDGNGRPFLDCENCKGTGKIKLVGY